MEPRRGRANCHCGGRAKEAAVTTRFQIAATIYMMVQAVAFGAGLVLILATPLQANAMTALPVMIAISFAVAAPLSWFIAPRLQARFWRAKGQNGDFISGPAVAATNP
jgi:hypothetical protein